MYLFNIDARQIVGENKNNEYDGFIQVSSFVSF